MCCASLIFLFEKILIIISVFAWCVLITYFYYKCVKPQRYWKEKGIIHEKPALVVGNLFRYLSYEFSLTELVQLIYNNHPNQRYVGFYKFNLPVLLLRDPELIHQLITEKLDNLPEHQLALSETVDSMWPKNLLDIPGGKQWQELRETLTPAFNKAQLRNMFGFVTECALKFVNHFANEGNLDEMNMDDAFERVTNDIIASAFFDMDCNSFKNPDNNFYWMGRIAGDLHYVKSMKFYEASVHPDLAKLFGVRFFKKRPTAYFTQLIEDIITHREKNNIIRTDVIHLLMEARKSNQFAQEDMLMAQAVQFILAGYYIVSTTMCYTAYELAIHSHIQERLRDEVDSILKNKMGRIGYEDLQKMKYMDMVISEVLRKWPPFPIIDRRPVVPFTIQPRNPDERRLTLYGDIAVQASVYSIHRGPKYYPDPDKFNPERFTTESIAKRQPYTYLPFGTGPRMCLGSSYALLQVKTVIFYLLTKFEIYPIERTAQPIVFKKHCVIPYPEDGFWLGLRPRDSPNSSEIGE